MRLNSWLAALSKTFVRQSATKSLEKKRRRMSHVGWLECLEERIVLSTFYVALTGNDTTGNGSIATPYRSIQKALDVANLDATGPHTIDVAAGTYSQAAFDKGFGIGSSAGPSPNLVGLTLSGGWNSSFTVQTNGSTTYIPQTNANNLNPGPTSIASDASTADIIVYTSGTTIRGFTFVFDGQAGAGGLRITGGLQTEAQSVVVTNNTIEVGYSNGNPRSAGIVVHSPAGGSEAGVQITNNTIVANAGSTFGFSNASTGIFVNPDTFGRVTPVIISGNNISGDNLGVGIALDRLSYVNVDGNTIQRTGSAVSSPLIDLRQATSGLGSYGAQTGINITNNTLNGFAPNGGNAGVDLSARGSAIDQVTGVNFTNNFVSNVSFGVATIQATVIGSGINAIENSFVNVTGKAFSFGGTGTMNGSRNWYGSSVAATVAGLISGLVDYTPYLNLATDTSGSTGFQPSYASLTVVAAGGQTGATGRIAEAIGLVTAGGTVNLAAGTYSENVPVNKNLSLVGNSPSDTFVNGGAGVGVTVVNPATAVTLQNLKIAGTPTAIANTTSPTLATVTLTNVLLLDASPTMTTITGTGNSDSIRIVLNGANLETYLGAALVDSRPANALPIIVNGGAGDDTFTIDLSGGNIIPAGGITFNGGGNSAIGDKLAVIGGTTTTVTHSFTNNNDGSMTLTGAIAGTITYTGLEPITDNVNAANRVFTFTGGAETITVTDAAGAFTRIDSSLGEFVDFAAPTTSLTINTNGGDSTTFYSFDAAFNTPTVILQDGTSSSTFSLGASNVFPDATAVTVNTNALLDLAGFSDTTANLTLNGTTLRNSTGTSALGGTVTLSTAAATVNVTGTQLTLSGQVTGTQALTKSGAGTLILSNSANDYAGVTTISAGTLAVTASGALGAVGANTVVNATATLDLRNVAYAATEPVSLNGGTLQTSTGTSSFAGTVALAASSTVDVTGTQLTLSGVISGGAGAALAKTGAGVLILNNAANTYSGATNINAGTVQINGTNSGTGAVSVNNSSILRGIGTIAGAVNVNNTARLAPGIAGPGTLTTGALTFASTAFLDVDVNGVTAAGTDYDRLVVNGAITLAGATLTPSIGAGIDLPTFATIVIINQVPAGAISGIFNGHPQGGIYDVSSERLRISYVESTTAPGNGNDVSLTVLPPPIVVNYTANGNLLLTGTDFVDDIIVDFSNTNSVTLTGNGYTNFIGAGTNGQSAGPYLVTGTLTINTNGENDVVVLRGLTASATLDSGDVNINLGAGDDILTTVQAVTPTLGLTMTGSLNVVGGLGNDTVRLGSNAANDTFSALNVSVDNGAGTGAQTIDLDRFTAHGNVTLTNNGAGGQTVRLGQNASNAPNTITGDLNIKQPSTATGYTVAIRNTAVNGLVSVINGSGTGAAAAVTIDTTTAQVIGGTTSITNGDNVTNSVSLVGTTGGLRSVGNVTVKNGIATTSNAITVNSLGNSGTTSSTFTNGASPANSISFLGTTGNAFTGLVAATNGLSTGTNAITATRLSATKGLTLTNGGATTSNTLTVGGSAGTSLVSVTGNVTLTNGTAATTSVSVDNLTVLGANAAGNLTIANGATGAGGTTVTFGAGALNSISGNLQITNQASSGTRAVVMNRTTISGRTGVNLYEVGGGNTTLTVGNNQLVTVAKAFVIQDGTGNSTVALQNLTVGSLNYTDIGGGVDTLDLGGTPAGTLTVNGVTRIDTGIGSDIVRTGGAGGTAVYNDSVFISLGSGNDSLTVGANAACPAFSSANKFQFDGGAGDDTFAASTLSIADYAPTTPLPKKIRSKITNFEHLS